MGAAVGDDGLAERGVGRREQDGKHERLGNESSAEGAAARSAPKAIVSGSPIPSSRAEPRTRFAARAA